LDFATQQSCGFIVDGYVLLKTKVKGVHRDEDHEFTEKVIRLKELKPMQRILSLSKI
jgi:hypothetical protein